MHVALSTVPAFIEFRCLSLLRNYFLPSWCFRRPGGRINTCSAQTHGNLSCLTPRATNMNEGKFCDAPSPIPSFQDEFKVILAQQLRAVSSIDTDVDRYLIPRNFRKFILESFDMQTLGKKGEDTLLRRIMHAHLSGPTDGDPLYRELMQVLHTSQNPWVATSENVLFESVTAKIVTSSKKASHLAEAKLGRAKLAKALLQLNASIEELLQQSVNSTIDMGTLRSKILERQERSKMMQGRLDRFDALIQVLAAIEEHLVIWKHESLAINREVRSTGCEVSRHDSFGDTKGIEQASVERARDLSQALGRAVEKEGREILENCLVKWMRQQTMLPAQSTPFLILTGVRLKSLDSEPMLAIRGDVVRESSRVYDLTDRPKAELDALVVTPTSTGSNRLQVLVAVEMKRSLHEIPIDCIKYHLSLEVCRRATPELLCFASSAVCSPASVRDDLLIAEALPQVSTENGFLLDFSSFRLPEDAFYIVKRGGVEMRAVDKLLLKRVHLRQNEKGFSLDEEALRNFYAPDFASLKNITHEERRMAEMKREAVIDALFDDFSNYGVESLRQRLSVIVKVLAGKSPASRGPLQNVFSLKEGDAE